MAVYRAERIQVLTEYAASVFPGRFKQLKRIKSAIRNQDITYIKPSSAELSFSTYSLANTVAKRLGLEGDFPFVVYLTNSSTVVSKDQKDVLVCRQVIRGDVRSYLRQPWTIDYLPEEIRDFPLWEDQLNAYKAYKMSVLLQRPVQHLTYDNSGINGWINVSEISKPASY